MSEAERHKLMRAFFRQAWYKTAGSPLFTMITVLTGEDLDEVFEDEGFSKWLL